MASRYVIVELRGRVGNQLWLFASGLGIARANDAELLFDASHIGPFPILFRDLIGDAYREATTEQMLRVGRLPWSNRWRFIFDPILKDVVNGSRRVRGRKPAAYFIPPPEPHWVPEWMALDLPAHIAHFLQSPHYFADVADEVFAAIRFPPGTPRLPHDLTAPGAGPTVAVSFRRSDYEPEIRLSLEYYERAIAVLGARTDLTNATFVLFSEDADFLELAEGWLAQFGAVRNVYTIDGTPLAQLSLIADCDHVIMANSSFAHWGAWLGDRRRRDRCPDATGRVVIYPESLDPGSGRADPSWLVLDDTRRAR